MTDHQEAVELIYQNLGALPHESFGHINVLPFAVESDQANAMKRAVAEGIVNVFSDAGFLVGRDAPAKPLHDVTLNCRMCGALLMNVFVDGGGIASVPAANVIATMASLSLDCPHKPFTADDQRRRIEEIVTMGEQDERHSANGDATPAHDGRDEW